MSHQISVLIVLDHFAQNLLYLTVLFPVLDLIERDDVHKIETSGEGHIVDDPVGGNGAELEQFGEGLIDLVFKIREVIEEPTYLSAGAVKVFSARPRRFIGRNSWRALRDRLRSQALRQCLHKRCLRIESPSHHTKTPVSILENEKSSNDGGQFAPRRANSSPVQQVVFRWSRPAAFSKNIDFIGAP
jgi:hypothetical protein